ncbi:hypothetical protein [Ignatzschineria cameli]|nr:hypothetical protein [Ignatzschineria cameli]
MSCRSLLSRSSKNYVPAVGIKDAIWRACRSEKNEIVLSRPSRNRLRGY